MFEFETEMITEKISKVGIAVCSAVDNRHKFDRQFYGGLQIWKQFSDFWINEILRGQQCSSRHFHNSSPSLGVDENWNIKNIGASFSCRTIQTPRFSSAPKLQEASGNAQIHFKAATKLIPPFCCKKDCYMRCFSAWWIPPACRPQPNKGRAKEGLLATAF